MLEIIAERLRQKHRTLNFPKVQPVMPDRFRGRPELHPERCPEGCRACLEVCPTGALARIGGHLTLDLCRCLFCPECVAACPHGGVAFTRDFRLAGRTRQSLVLGSGAEALATALDARLAKLFGRSLKLREVSAGGCNACEADANVLTTLVFDIGRFGIEFVASPRHADGLYVTGPVTGNMREALLKTYAALPEPKIVIAAGACAISGGPFIGLPEAGSGTDPHIPVDLYVPGCPPHPWTVLDGLLRLLNRL